MASKLIPIISRESWKAGCRVVRPLTVETKLQTAFECPLAAHLLLKSRQVHHSPLSKTHKTQTHTTQPDQDKQTQQTLQVADLLTFSPGAQNCSTTSQAPGQLLLINNRRRKYNKTKPCIPSHTLGFNTTEQTAERVQQPIRTHVVSWGAHVLYRPTQLEELRKLLLNITRR
jgi:hypothetical protein